MKRYSIMVRQAGGSNEFEFCQVDSDPHGLAKAVAEKTMRVRLSHRLEHIPMYDSVRVVDHHEEVPHE